MLAAWLAMPDAKRSMDALSEQLLFYKSLSIETLIGPKGKDQGSMADVPLKQLARYAAEDADVTWQLAEALADELEDSGQMKVFSVMECPLIPVLVEMEAAGITP